MGLQLHNGISEQAALSTTCSGKTCFKTVSSVGGNPLSEELMTLVKGAVGFTKEIQKGLQV